MGFGLRGGTDGVVEMGWSLAMYWNGNPHAS